MDDISICLARLTDKDARSAFRYTEAVLLESRRSDCWYAHLHEFAALMSHRNSFVRSRAAMVIAANARWDNEGKINMFIDELLEHITDEKPVTARQYLKVLPEIAEYKPELAGYIRTALENADLTAYADSMRPLVNNDIIRVLKKINDNSEIH